MAADRPPALPPPAGDALAAVAGAIDPRRPTLARPLVVALDGLSGAGKSTLARQLVAARDDAAHLPLDDFFAADIPDACWDAMPFDERLARLWHWQRVRRCALEPLLAGRPARWHAFDFVGGLRADGTYGLQAQPTELAPAAVVLVEGLGVTAGPLNDLLDLTVLVQLPEDVRLQRLAAREEPAFLAAWRRRWDPFQAWYFGVVRPAKVYDLVVWG